MDDRIPVQANGPHRAALHLGNAHPQLDLIRPHHLDAVDDLGGITHELCQNPPGGERIVGTFHGAREQQAVFHRNDSELAVWHCLSQCFRHRSGIVQNDDFRCLQDLVVLAQRKHRCPARL